MRRTVQLLGIVIVFCIAAFCITLLIGGRDMPAPDVSDLIPEKTLVPDDQNSFQHIITAADALALPPDLNTLIQYIEGKQFYATLVADLIKKNEPAFPLIRKALTFNRCQSANEDTSDYISKYYQIAVLLAAQAIYDRQSNRLSHSIQSTISLLRFGDMLHSDAQNLIVFGASVRILQLGLNQAAVLARTEVISADDLRQLAQALSDLKPLDQGLKQAFQFKFQEVSNQIDGFRASNKSIEQTFSDTALMPYILRKTTWFPGYLFKENETKQKLAVVYRDTIQNTERIYADMKIYDLTQYLGLMGSKFAFMIKPNFVGRLFYAFTTPEIDTYLEGKCQMEGSIQGTRLIVALQLFKRKNGALPDQLVTLCPDYLPIVPLDPFDGKPFRYSASKGIVYSVSKDLIDSDGSTEIPPGEIYGEDYPKTWIAFDGVFKIDP